MKRITTQMMAEALGMPVQTIRVGLQVGAFEWGECFKPTGKKHTYVIYPEKVKPLVPEKYHKEWGLA